MSDSISPSAPVRCEAMAAYRCKIIHQLNLDDGHDYLEKVGHRPMSPHSKPVAASKPANPAPARSSTTHPTKTAHRDELARRVRAAFSGRHMRELHMFGGVSFMVDGRMVVAAGRAGDLLVRIDPDRHERLLQVPGAGHAVMGADRPMGPGWVRVERPHLKTDDELSFWIRTALEFHAAQTKRDS